MFRTLVAYFSASGVTAKLSQQLAKSIGADLYEIRPKSQYSPADLDWRSENARSTIEMQNRYFRPEIKDDDFSIEKYNKIFLGFPIWWYLAPTIINTFLESHNFAKKTVVIFATSGGSGFGNTMEELKPSITDGAKLIEGEVLNGSYTDKELSKWARTQLKKQK